MSTPHAKRRRLNESTSALHKPFRSPLKTTSTTSAQGIKSKTPSRLGQSPSNFEDIPNDPQHPSSPAYGEHFHDVAPNSDLASDGKAPAQERHKNGSQAPCSVRAPDELHGGNQSGITKQSLKTEIPNSEDEASPLSLSSPTLNPLPQVGPQEPVQTATPSSTSLSTTTTATGESPVKRPGSPVKPHLSLKRSQADLKQQRHVTELRDQIALLKAHPAISTSIANTKDKLEALIKTWTRVAQDAADVLYPDVKERVEAAGGVQTFSPKKNGSSAGFGGDDDKLDELEEHIKTREKELDRGIDAQGEHLRGAEKTQQRREVNDMKDRLAAARSLGSGRLNGHSVAELEDEAGQQEFTMGLMLRGMNIEHELIGWDEEHDQWKDLE